MKLQAIEWESSGAVRRLLVAGDDWLSYGLLRGLQAASTQEDVDPTPETIAVERGALHLVADDAVQAAATIILIDPHEDERLRTVGLHAGNPRVRINVLGSHAADGAAEHAMTLILGLSRRLFAGYSSVVNGSWSEPPLGPTLTGMTLGVLGLGRSGQTLARRAAAFGMPLLYHDLARKPDVESRLAIQWRRFDQILREADIVSLHLPTTHDTVRLIDAPELAAMKSSALLVNVADGGLIDEGSLVKALRNGDIAGAGLDNFAFEPLSPDSPLIGFENVVLTPRVAWMSTETERGVWLREIVEYLTGKAARSSLSS